MPHVADPDRHPTATDVTATERDACPSGPPASRSGTAELARLGAHYQAMPPVAAMQLRIEGFDGRRLQLHAPLSVHVNDKGCAFGGSLASMMTLASWGVVSMLVERAGLHADVFVADSQVRYLAPLFADLDVSAEPAADADLQDFIATLRSRGRARLGMVARAALPDGGVATEFTARYVAIARDPAGQAAPKA